MRVRLVLAALMLVPLLGACDGENEVTMPPLTPEPGDSRLADTATTAPEAESLPARLALYRFLRGAAAGNVKACALLTPGYERAAFGAPGGCLTGLRRARAKLRPQDVTALRGVTVPAAEAGPDASYLVRYGDLKWRGAPARFTRPGRALVLPSYTIRRHGGRWLLDI